VIAITLLTKDGKTVDANYI
jgi:hypothetical protein